MKQLIEMHYDRNDLDFKRGTFRVRGDVLEIIPTYENQNGIRIEFFGDEIDRISEIDTLTGKTQKIIKNTTIFPASHFVTSEDKLKEAIKRIKQELEERLKELRDNNKLLEAERLEQRTNYDKFSWNIYERKIKSNRNKDRKECTNKLNNRRKCRSRTSIKHNNK